MVAWSSHYYGPMLGHLSLFVVCGSWTWASNFDQTWKLEAQESDSDADSSSSSTSSSSYSARSSGDAADAGGAGGKGGGRGMESMFPGRHSKEKRAAILRLVPFILAQFQLGDSSLK